MYPCLAIATYQDGQGKEATWVLALHHNLCQGPLDLLQRGRSNKHGHDGRHNCLAKRAEPQDLQQQSYGVAVKQVEDGKPRDHHS